MPHDTKPSDLLFTALFIFDDLMTSAHIPTAHRESAAAGKAMLHAFLNSYLSSKTRTIGAFENSPAPAVNGHVPPPQPVDNKTASAGS